jgi:hypothetical protein
MFNFSIRAAHTWTAAVCLLFVSTGGSLAAQTRDDRRLPEGTISGLVQDAETAGAISGATVVLHLEETGALPSEGSGGSAFLGTSRSTVTDASGRYRFGGLSPGRYRLRAERVGYRAATLAVELRGSADSRVAIGLSVEPIPLLPVEITVEALSTYGRDRRTGERAESGRLAAARVRQRASLATDAREVTHAGGALGQPRGGRGRYAGAA